MLSAALVMGVVLAYVRSNSADIDDAVGVRVTALPQPYAAASSWGTAPAQPSRLPTWTFRYDIGGTAAAPPWVSFRHFRRLCSHPWHDTRLLAREKADLELVCCLHMRNVPRLSELPPRPAHRPYVIWMEALRFWSCEACKGVTAKRDGRLFVACDDVTYRLCLEFRNVTSHRRDLVFTGFGPGPPGSFVALAPPHVWRKAPPADLGRWRYLATFRGTVRAGNPNYRTRERLKRSLGMPQDDPGVAARLHELGVVVETLDLDGGGAASRDSRRRYEDLMDTAFALLPRGDGLWSFRFSDAVGACAIPVVLADKIILPFEPLVNWTSAALVLPEALAQDREALLAALPRSPAVIKQMRERVCQIRALYFETMERRFDALLRAASAMAQSRRGQRV